MKIVIVFLALITIRYDILNPINDNMGSIIAFSVLKVLGAMFYLYLASFYMTHLKYIADIKVRYFVYLLVGLTCIPVLSMGNTPVLITDIFSLLLVTIFLLYIILFGDSVFESIYNVKPLNEGEIEKAFLTYPPKSSFDFLFFYIIVVIILSLPTVVSWIWKGVILK